jgi:uncharacterized membrane protein YdjX (TVP38/TMEM64 family)
MPHIAITKHSIFLVLLFGIAIACFFLLDLDKYTTIEYFKSRQEAITGYQEQNPLLAPMIFFSLYVIFTGLSLPVAGIMTIIAGALFGLIQGVVLVSFASSLGATLAFLLSRYLFRSFFQDRYSQKLKVLNHGIEREGAFYLFSLRMIPVFPFFMVNAIMGLTLIDTRVFYFASQAGMLPLTVIYVNAGSQIARINSVGDVLSPSVFLSFTLLGVFPLISKKIVYYLRARRAMTNDDIQGP